ncbi:MAG: peptidylprolyl isomerase [Pirellulaceae bacterium]|nr:peptidylprolyl isomerase [Pirellulaceae bacterium]
MKSKRPKRTQANELQYDRLEERQLLAADLIRAPIVNLPQDKNLVVNSGFEQATGGVNNMYNVNNVPGWNTVAGGGNQVKLFPIGSNSRGNVLQIDHTANQRDGIYQDIAVKNGRQYLISFELRSFRTGSAQGTQDIEVLWNGVSLGVFSPTERFERYRLMTPVSTNSSARLEFREAASQGSSGDDGIGALLDNVQVVQLTNNSLRNGGFENGTSAGENSKVFGWHKRGTTPFVILPQTGPANETILKLDSDSDNVDLIRQNIQTTADQTYLISFNARLAPGQTPGQLASQLRVRFGDQFVGVVLPTQEWNRFHLLARANGDSSDLVLREAGIKNGAPHTGDGLGPWISDVQVTRVTANWELGIQRPNSPVKHTVGSEPTPLMNENLTVFNRVRTQLTHATISILNRLNGANEILSAVTTGTAITAVFDAARGVLTLTGTDSIQNYKQVLESVAYKNIASDAIGGTRQVRVAINDQGAVSDSLLISVNVETNQAPLLTPISNQTINAGQEFVLQVNATDPNGDPLTYSIEASGTALRADETGPTISSSGEFRWTPDQGGILNVKVTVTDSHGASASESFVLTSQLNLPLSGFQPFSGQRQLSFVPPSLRDRIYTQAPAMNIDTSKNYRATIHTDLGILELDLFASQAPIAVNSFVNLVRDGYYDGLNFHRVINDLGNRFVAQGGDPLGVGTGGPGYVFVDETDASLKFDKAGVLAMANSGPTTNGSQFFITYSPQPHLDGKHTIFGQLVSGSGVLDQFQSTQGSSDRVIMRRVIITEI